MAAETTTQWWEGARLDAADGFELDAAAPELGAHFEVRGHVPAGALADAREDGGVVHHLLRHHAEAAARVDVLEGLAEQRVERLARAPDRARVPARACAPSYQHKAAKSPNQDKYKKANENHAPGDGKYSDEEEALGGGAGRARGALEEARVLKLLRDLLQRGEGLVEVDGEADAREVLADALLDDAPQRHRLLRLRGLRQLAAALHGRRVR